MVCCRYQDSGILGSEGELVRDILTDDIGRSRSFKVCSCVRPWFRAFHLSWISFFLAFFGWFAIVPAIEYLIAEPENDIDLDAAQSAAIASVVGTVFLRLLIGPLCERYGPRRLQCAILFFGGASVLGSAGVSSATGLIVSRFITGFIGAAFVPCQYWTSMMFAGEVVGQANAFAGGWGNLGAGVASVAIAGLIAAWQSAGLSDNLSWRVAMCIPGVVLTLFPIPLYFSSDDCPQGHWSKRLYRKAEKLQGASAQRSPWVDWRVWILFVQYACCFGVELAINNSLTSYLFRNFLDDSGNCSSEANFASESEYLDACSLLGKNNAAIVAGLFGLMNLFARALGGLLSDHTNRRFFMRGRLFTQAFYLFMQGVLLIIFSQIQVLEAAIVVLILFSTFVQGAEGSTFALVPFMSNNIGVVAGIVGAGGNVGAVCWSTMIRTIPDTSQAYTYLGVVVILSSLLTTVFPVKATYMFCGPNYRLDKNSSAIDEESDTTTEQQQQQKGDQVILQ